MEGYQSARLNILKSANATQKLTERQRHKMRKTSIADLENIEN